MMGMGRDRKRCKKDAGVGRPAPAERGHEGGEREPYFLPAASVFFAESGGLVL
jgi:hypothetical protein